MTRESQSLTDLHIPPHNRPNETEKYMQPRAETEERPLASRLLIDGLMLVSCSPYTSLSHTETTKQKKCTKHVL